MTVGSKVTLVDIKSSGRLLLVLQELDSQNCTVVGVSSAKQFIVGLSTDPGVFTNATNVRDKTLQDSRSSRLMKL